ncbi:MAG TPA: hypothetical protein DCZ94_05930 [Lentisphaeria bacterium]|nr:MAG: hypothetical protein A2X48_07440 [Lentisphaerae bacterium GWF2_49_21]HBC86475.1 hypothetical protein [Lentisphaeria bacterium]
MLALPVNIKDITSGHAVEWERIGFTVEFPVNTAFREAVAGFLLAGQGTSQSHSATRSPTQSNDPLTHPVTPPLAPPGRKLIELLAKGDMGNAEIRELLALKDREAPREHYIEPALASGLVEYTIPGKPNSRLQKYRLREKGRKMITVVS